MAAPKRSRARVRGLRPRGEADAIVVVIDGRVERAAVAALCERVRALVQAGDADVVVCDVGALGAPDLAAVDLLARVQLTARRLGRRVALRRASPELARLVALAGLAGVVPLEPLRVEARRQAEHREQRLGVEEERDRGDDPA